MPEPDIQNPEEFQKDVRDHGLRYDPKQRIREYLKHENPRGLPEKWIHAYLERDRILLALDVMRVFDKSAKVEEKLGWNVIWIRILTAVVVAQFGIIGFFIQDYLAKH